MFSKIFKTTSFIIIILFFYLVFSIYFSEKNIRKINTNRLEIKKTFKNYSSDLTVLESDTNDVIFYNSENISEKKIRKRKFWELLKKK
tara:strand:+ start:136 stop:399 length:264 start_codon:yes stop_codon:yes gene_type:complete